LTTTAWRVVKARYAATSFDGEGAREFGGRWNSIGHAVVYTAATTSLGLLEILVHADAVLLPHYVAVAATFDNALVEVIDPDLLPDDWRSNPPPFGLRRLGDEWIRSGRSCVLELPSVVIPHERNYLLNPAHEDFSHIEIGGPITLDTDHRLL